MRNSSIFCRGCSGKEAPFSYRLTTPFRSTGLGPSSPDARAATTNSRPTADTGRVSSCTSEPVSTQRPLAITATSSASSVTEARSWLMNTTPAAPEDFQSRSSASSSARLAASSEEVTSSSTSTSGSRDALASAAATDHRKLSARSSWPGGIQSASTCQRPPRCRPTDQRSAVLYRLTSFRRGSGSERLVRAPCSAAGDCAARRRRQKAHHHDAAGGRLQPVPQRAGVVCPPEVHPAGTDRAGAGQRRQQHGAVRCADDPDTAAPPLVRRLSAARWASSVGAGAPRPHFRPQHPRRAPASDQRGVVVSSKPVPDSAAHRARPRSSCAVSNRCSARQHTPAARSPAPAQGNRCCCHQLGGYRFHNARPRQPRPAAHAPPPSAPRADAAARPFAQRSQRRRVEHRRRVAAIPRPREPPGGGRPQSSGSSPNSRSRRAGPFGLRSAARVVFRCPKRRRRAYQRPAPGPPGPTGFDHRHGR